MSSVTSLYTELMGKVKDILILDSAVEIVRWDMETMMPPKAIELRSRQLALLSRIKHKMSTNPEIGRLLEEIIKHPEYEALDAVQRRNIYLVKKNYEEQTRLPEDLVAEIERQKAITTDCWKKAKAMKNFAILKPELRKLFDLQKRAAEILMDIKGTETPYDALIDIFEPGITAEKITKVFNELQSDLVLILKRYEYSLKNPDISILKRKVPIEIQRRIARALAEAVGYDVTSGEARGRIDESEHPFTAGYYDDVRITTHYYEDNFASSIFSILHEAGHALYEQNLKREWIFQPVGSTCSMGFHESQSRFMENIIGRSREFWTHFLPRLKDIGGNIFSDVDFDSFVYAINYVKPSKIRVEADEVTYCLHIIIRFNLERDLFAEKVAIDELPHLWNQQYEEILGVKIENDSEGLMQDTHWASGLFGYFPSYALGNIYSGQILEAMEKDLPDWRKMLESGQIRQIVGWLAKNVHSYGNLYDPLELLVRITEKELDAKPYLNYLREKYSKLADQKKI